MNLSQKELMDVKVLLLYHQSQKRRTIRMTKMNLKKMKTKVPIIDIRRMKTRIKKIYHHWRRRHLNKINFPPTTKSMLN